MKYSFVSLASCYLDDDHLQLSSDVLCELEKLDEIMSKQKNMTTDQCNHIFQNFGSHSFQGPFHFGGMYMWRCFTSGFKQCEREQIQMLHDDIIDAQVRMSLDQCSEKRCVSDIAHSCASRYPDKIKKHTYTQVIIVGGPENVIGFPDWKTCLLGSNRTWKLIDCGINKVPIWDIILKNHQKLFKNASGLATELRKQWQTLHCTDPTVRRYSDDIKRFVQSWSRILKPPFHNALKQLLNKRNEIEGQVLDPYAWASEYLTSPHLQEFLCSIVRKCDDREMGIINGLLQELVEPTDLGIVNVFSCVENAAQKVYKTEKIPVLILRDHFIRTQRYFKSMYEYLALHSNEAINPYYLIRASTVVAKAVHILQRHLVMTDQLYEECLLLTLLYPLQYIPGQGRFFSLLTKLDIDYLYNNFANLSLTYFELLDQHENKQLTVQSYLFYLTIHVSEVMPASDECIVSHINYLKRKFEITPEILPFLEHSSGWISFRNDMENIFSGKKMEERDSYPPQDNFVAASTIEGTNRSREQCVAKTEKTQSTTLLTSKEISKDIPHCELLTRLGLLEYFPQKLSLQDALQIREDTLQSEYHQSGSEQKIGDAPHAFVMVQKILSFDHRCRMAYSFNDKPAECDAASDSNSDDDETDDSSIHPLDSLLALLYCSNNFLRQDLLKRLATCQIALPLILPDPSTEEPTLLLWAMRSIVKVFKLQNNTLYTGRLITYPAPFVSFLRIGNNSMSKSETLNGVINNQKSDNKNVAFLGHNYSGGKTKRVLVDGLVEISWYLPGDDLFDKAIAFTNLRGDASILRHKKQVNLLCELSTMHVVLITDAVLQEDAPRHDAIELLKRLSFAPGGVVLVHTESQKGFKDRISQHFDSETIKSKFSIIRYDTSSTTVYEKIQRKIQNVLKVSFHHTSLEDAAHKHGISIDEDDPDCLCGRKYADELYVLIEKHQQESSKNSPKDLLPLQREHLWHTWAMLDKEQYRQKSHYRLEQHCEHNYDDDEVQQHQQVRRQKMSIQQYSEEQRKKMNQIRSEQYPLATTKMNILLATFVNTLQTLKGHVLWYYISWLRFKLDDLSRKILPPFHAKIREKRNELSSFQKQQNETAVEKCQKELKVLDKELVNASFGLEHLLREVSQIYEAVAAQEDIITNPRSPVGSLPRTAAHLLCDGFPIELLDGDASHMPQKWISAVLSSLSTVLEEKYSCEPKIYVLSVLGVQSTGKSTLLNTLFGVQFSVSAGRCTRGAFMQLIPVHQSLHKKLGVHYFLLIDTEGLRAPELDRLNSREHDNELATFVIGVANLTLINVAGEVAGDMDDILHTAVYAFLRMRQVSLKPSCHIVHQHVAAVGAEEKIIMGRFKTKDNLDKMTKAAAKETGLQARYTLFTDVIKFDHENDVYFFPDFWNGKPPMARVSSGYSEAAQRLKSAIIFSCTEDAKYQIILL